MDLKTKTTKIRPSEIEPLNQGLLKYDVVGIPCSQAGESDSQRGFTTDDYANHWNNADAVEAVEAHDQIADHYGYILTGTRGDKGRLIRQNGT